jgi:two-component system phosphate regulon sensor histidine kinase PhoR
MADDSLNLCVTDDIASEIIRSMSDGVLVMDRTGLIISINPAALEMLGLNWEDVRGIPFPDLFVKESPNSEFVDAVMRCITTPQPMLKKELRYVKSDGGFVDLALNGSPLIGNRQDGTGGAVVLVIRDETEIKSLDRARKRVLDHLSHELKTPLAIIKGSIHRVKAGSPGAAWDRVQRNLKRLEEIQSEVDDIIRHQDVSEDYPFRRWLEQVLDLADLLAEGVPACGDSLHDLRGTIEGLFAKEDVPRQTRARLGSVAQKVLREAREQSSHRNLAYIIRLDGDPEVHVAPEVLEKALMAPLKNAIENTPDGGKISVTLETLGGKAGLTIEDTGVGITEESQKQIFSGFYHARQTDLYSTKRPFDFGAGGKGLDLLRLRIVSQAYGFGIEWKSKRCRHIPAENLPCPGKTETCPHIRQPGDCAESGGTLVRLTFDVVS